MTFREVDKILRDNGWKRKNKGNGSSHIIYLKGQRKVPVPYNTGDIPIGTLNSIMKLAGLK